MRKDLDNNKDKIIELLESGVPRFEICRKFKCKYDTLKSRLDNWGVIHKNQSGKGIADLKKRKHSSIYFDNLIGISSAKLRIKLLNDGLKEYRCEICKNTEWNNKPIPLELDHINGNHFDNSFNNLRLICPNCHAQTPTNSGSNIGKYNAFVGELVDPSRLGRDAK